MGFFDKFKKNKEDKYDKQIAELQAKNAALATDTTAQDAENMMRAFTADTLSGAPVLGAAALDAAKTFDSLAESLGVKTNMTKTMAQHVELPNIIEIKAGSGSSNKNNFIFGVDSNYAPVYYCVETEKAYAPGWAGLIDMIVDTDMFNTNGEDSDGVPSEMSIEAGTAKKQRLYYGFRYRKKLFSHSLLQRIGKIRPSRLGRYNPPRNGRRYNFARLN